MSFYEPGNYLELPNTDEGRAEWVLQGFTAAEDECWMSLWWRVFSPAVTYAWRAAFREAGL